MNQSTQETKKTDLLVSVVEQSAAKETVFFDSNPEVLFEPVHTESYDLTYTCLLIPRFPAHQMKGDLAQFIPQWLQQICLSHGWRLELISVQTDYMQWTIMVPPSTAPGQFIQQIRFKISRMIFEHFGRFKRENLSNDFFAPGYLVVLGDRPHPEEMIFQYIRLTRRQQGLIGL